MENQEKERQAADTDQYQQPEFVEAVRKICLEVLSEAFRSPGL